MNTSPKNVLKIGQLALPCLLLAGCANPVKNAPPVTVFIDKMVIEHHFDAAELADVFASVAIKDDLLTKIAKPSEAMPWYKYRKIFLTNARIEGGIKFWRDNAQALAEAQRRYGVPPEIIVAILGVETLYGQHTGKYRVLDALATLAFAYPPRSPFFSSELENYLLLCREEQLNPQQPTGSYAGAMGIPQFMPSSFRNYATDFDHDGKRDIWHNQQDVIGSVALYFAEHGWQRGQAIAAPATAKGQHYKEFLTDNLKPDLRVAQLESLSLKIPAPLPPAAKVKILELKQEQGEELWVVLDNFYTITRYNHSPLYAMAVFQLSQAMLNKIGAIP